MKEVKLIEDMPMMRNKEVIWGYKCHIFEVLEEKELPKVGLCYKIRFKDYPSMVMDGWCVANNFKGVGK